MEEDFISKDLISSLEHHLRYFLQGYELPISLNVEFDPLTQDVSIQSITYEEGKFWQAKFAFQIEERPIKDATAQAGITIDEYMHFFHLGRTEPW